MAGKKLVAGAVVLIVLAAAGLFLAYQRVEQVTVEFPEFEEIDDFLAGLEDYVAFENTDYDFEMEEVFGVE
jgi:hypothetical protein